MNENSRDLISRCLFKKKDRLKKYKDIKHIIYYGSKTRSRNIYLYFLETSQSRIAFLVNREKNAVKRNRVKRILREICRQKYKNQKYDFAIKVIKRLGNENYKNIDKEIEDVFKKIEMSSKSE